ncbi:hypothetical protein [Actinoplanes solisilvae]|uniref:hypothetical protein n=1 Tax=Actinoplanes solisilvae TaxID=2486853 RepID=UPI000FDBBA22|nr:hypothetical protein [Actinoplanes solisilvae]
MDEQTLWALVDHSPEHADRDSWLHPHLGTTTGGGHAPREYVVALRHVAMILDADPRWRSWWQQSGLAACELGIVAEGRLDHLRPSADIRRFDDRLQANFTCALPAGPPTAGTVEQATRTAAEEVRAMFEVIRQALTLPALPPTPPVPSPPTDVPDVPVTAKRVPDPPHEPERQGYLTLTQIQEFFA